ncbi:MAG TPA: DUF4256 domain-containing protein, partial [Kaistella chaponensis]|nr:DUF4256 domain-containing protein [Kaistella chaponensis]
MDSKDNYDNLLHLLKERFKTYMHRHEGLKWEEIQKKLKENKKKLESVQQMEESGGEPDVVGFDENSGEYLFYDCAAESPKGRRSFCYDQAALDKRKENKPKNNAVQAAQSMGIEILMEEEYRYLQTLGNFDTKTSSW